METKAASLNLKLRRGGKLRNSMSFSAYNFTWPSSDMGEVCVLPQWISTGPWQTSHSLLVSSAKLEQAPCSAWKWEGVAQFLWDTGCQGFHDILPGAGALPHYFRTLDFSLQRVFKMPDLKQMQGIRQNGNLLKHSGIEESKEMQVSNQHLLTYQRQSQCI